MSLCAKFLDLYEGMGQTRDSFLYLTPATDRDRTSDLTRNGEQMMTVRLLILSIVTMSAACATSRKSTPIHGGPQASTLLHIDWCAATGLKQSQCAGRNAWARSCDLIKEDEEQTYNQNRQYVALSRAGAVVHDGLSEREDCDRHLTVKVEAVCDGL